MNANHISFSLPPGLHEIPPEQLDLRSDDDLDRLILDPPPVTSEKNVCFFWDTGYENMHSYAQRNIRAWHRRLGPLGWTIRVMDLSSPQGKSHIAWEWRGQIVSDLIRFPPLLVYGGVYADVTTMQVGDVNALWNSTIADPSNNYEILWYNFGDEKDARIPMNYFMAARPGNAFFQQANRILLELWAQDGGRSDPTGLVGHELMKNAPQMKGLSAMTSLSNAKLFEDLVAEMTNYNLQMILMGLVLGTVDERHDWNGPEYTVRHIFAMSSGPSLLKIYTGFDGTKAFNLLSLPLPKDSEHEFEKQIAARILVETVLQQNFAVKLAHGPIAKIFGDSLGMHWRKNEGYDNVPGTYAHWLRYVMVHWTQGKLPSKMEYGLRAPLEVRQLQRSRA